MWVYVQSESTLWTVGFYGPAGDWHPDTDHGDRESAARRVAWLNGERGVAAEPNEETESHGPHLPPSAWQESPMAAPHQEPLDDWRKDDRTL